MLCDFFSFNFQNDSNVLGVLSLPSNYWGHNPYWPVKTDLSVAHGSRDLSHIRNVLGVHSSSKIYVLPLGLVLPNSSGNACLKPAAQVLARTQSITGDSNS